VCLEAAGGWARFRVEKTGQEVEVEVEVEAERLERVDLIW
jgi:hypothetical protein